MEQNILLYCRFGILIFILIPILKKIAHPNTHYVMRKIYTKISLYFRNIYHLSISAKKYDKIVFKHLIKHHKDLNWHFGVFEVEKYIVTPFNISENTPAKYYYMIFDGKFHCQVKILNSFPKEITTELFILATHFNNLLRNGIVTVDVEDNTVNYSIKSDLIVNIIYQGEIHHQILNHLNTSRDIFWAFNRLIEENEEPALIIADLLKMKDENKSED
jgi:hypothetical protein